jgi:sulfur carrier protein
MSAPAVVAQGRAVVVNGEARDIEAGASVATLLASLGRHPRTVAVERNGLIVPRATYDQVLLVAGDRLEIVAFTQGG